jgi:hypothetical protein
MYREYLRRVLGHPKRGPAGWNSGLTLEEFYQQLQLSEVIIDYGRMIQAYYHFSVPKVA